jgi:hypothetical protein
MGEELMTPEERAVIEAAIRWSRTETVGQAEDASEALQDLVADLLRARTAPDYEVPRRPTEAEYGSLPILDPAILKPAALVWVETTMRQCLAGDRIRIGAEETDVIRSSSGIWHADSSDAWHPRAWEHMELRMELAVVPGFTQYPPNASVEILCTPERKALLLLQGSFPGATVIS